ncbi:hypothetical protein [Lactiplantibacillus mudanjiangensis]|uniref:DUF2334 domain-containing protein n=1 Tax=Lactiplantibacillus mudanjiangensis TaxID=1296538 RepID=A0A660DZ49_9LACO|nr:hypothetical protein [Lactiplantibacillus mudanjiangensis]VDG24357.1 hypothetical protein [Lactobacillus sp. CBA3606] [Lactiplantibacillus mudanjiangensis]VDG28344.1 hypothetical protein [Lactobacillus sp. CBA3606] [Lactiplantibacillus mudanjiangensis]
MKLKTLWRWGLLIVALFSFWYWGQPSSVEAATSKVLLVYDSQNVAQNDQTKIAAVQRLLTSVGVRVTTKAAADYRAGTLKHYQGVITMINWPQTDLNNADFVRDRQRFKGIRLHIGQNLTAAEAQGLQAKRQKLYHQQFTLQNKSGSRHQLLAFSETMTTLTQLPAKAQTIGWLKSQSVTKKTYPYGTIVGNQGYLPYFSAGGYSFVLAAQTIAQLFGKVGHYQPLLTITKVTPYSNMAVLDRLSRYLYQQSIPFAISTTTVGSNVHFKAYQRFARVLRNIENRGGVVFLKTPAVGGVTASSGKGLATLMDNYLIQFAQNQVFPVGISTSGYWNQDQVYRQYALTKADHILLLPNPASPVYAKQDNQATTFKQAIYGLNATSLETVRQGSALGKLADDFPVPTAVTFTMPNSQRSLNNLKRRLSQLNYQWFNPATEDTATKIVSGTATFQYRNGTYFLNGQATTITATQPHTKTLAAVKPEELWVNRFFKMQGTVLLIFFAITFGVFVLFIFLGRRVYVNMFKRK